MTETTLTLDSRIAAFATAVRAELADLPADEVDELAEGLEADLADQAADNDGELSLPDAVAYAEELRSAAGLPPREDTAPARVPLRALARDRGEALVAGIRSSRAGAGMLDFVIALRPLWWVARGWAIFVFLVPLTGTAGSVPGLPWGNFGGSLLLGALVILSVQWGRGRWLPARWLRTLRTVVSVITAIALPFMIVTAIEAVRSSYDDAAHGGYSDPPAQGLSVDGERVRNIFAYDDAGHLLTVRLFDQAGRPLTTVGDAAAAEDWQWDYYFYAGYGGGPVPVPHTEPGRAPVWNMYPLDEALADESGDIDPATAGPPIPPFDAIAPLSTTSDPTPSPSPTPTADTPADETAPADSAAGTTTP